jgi:predicted permease
LPFAGGDRLLHVDAWNPERGDGDAPLTWADVDALRSSDAFDEVGAYGTRSLTLTGGEHAERMAGAMVTPGLFEQLGVRPRLGRLFRADEGAEAGFEQVVIISDGLWQRHFGGDPDVVGRSLEVNQREVVVVGVMEPGFRFPERHDAWLPLGTADRSDHNRRYMIGVASLAEGAGLEAARSVAAGWSRQAAAAYPSTHAGWPMRVQPFRHGWIDAADRQLLALLLAAVGFVLLLACANVANLLLARATDRQEELTVRAALGAGGWRLAHQLLIEGLLLGLVGGALGVLVARVWVDAFAHAIPEELTFWIRVAIDAPVLLYALAISVGTSLCFSVLPALQASRANDAETLRSAGRGVIGGRGRARASLVIAEVGLAMVLLVSATLMVRSFLALQRADPGFSGSGLLSLRIVQAGDRYDDPVVRAEYYGQVSERLASVPGAVSAAATSAIPADDGGSGVQVLPEGTPEDEALNAIAIISTRGLFETLKVELVSGRSFTEAEASDPEADVAVVGVRLAERLWPGEDATGRRVVLPEVGTFRVIGVAPDLQYEEFGEDLESARLQVHLPYGIAGYRGMAVLVRSSGDPAGLVGPVRDELAAIDPTLAPYDILTMEERRSLTTWEQRLFGNSFAAFGLIALVLAVCGIYAVIAYSVARRTREMGIRIALGARPGELRTQVVGGALKLAGIGAAIGLASSLLFARALRGILYGVSSTDPRVFAGAGAVLLLASLAASLGPAHRAARIDPTESLRES